MYRPSILDSYNGDELQIGGEKERVWTLYSFLALGPGWMADGGTTWGGGESEMGHMWDFQMEMEWKMLSMSWTESKYPNAGSQERKYLGKIKRDEFLHSCARRGGSLLTCLSHFPPQGLETKQMLIASPPYDQQYFGKTEPIATWYCWAKSW